MVIRYYYYFQFLSFLLSIYFYGGLKAFKLLGFIPILFIVCVTELLASNPGIVGQTGNHEIYNYYLVVSTPFTFYVFLQMLGYKKLVRAIYVSVAILLFTFVMLNFLFLQRMHTVNTYSLLLVEFVNSILALLVIAKLFQEDDTDIFLNQHPYFWIAASTLLFSAVTLIVLGLQQFIQLNSIQWFGRNIYKVIMPAINVVLYLPYSYAFYLCNKLTSNNKSLQP